MVNFTWSTTVTSIADLIKNGTLDICLTVFKSIEDLLSNNHCVDLFMNNIGVSFKILDAASEWLQHERQETQNPSQRKPSSLKLFPVIVETLKKIYNHENVVSDSQGFRMPYLQIIIPTYS